MSVHLADGTPVHTAGPPDAGAPLLLWCGGTPSTGAVLEPVRAAAAAHGLRVASWARPGFAGRARRPGRLVADAGQDAQEVLDGLGARRALVVGYSGGGPHAVAVAALVPGRVVGVGLLASPAPFAPAPRRSDGGWSDDWWFQGMAAPGALRAATRGLAAREEHARHEVFDPAQFTDADWDALRGPWRAVGEDAQAASSAGGGSVGVVPAGQVDDDVALTTGWGFDLSDVRVPVVVAHGSADRVIPVAHAASLTATLTDARRLDCGAAGHVAVLESLPGLLAALLG